MSSSQYRFGFQEILDQAQNKVDFFRLFRTIVLGHELEHFAIFDIRPEHNDLTLHRGILLDDWPGGWQMDAGSVADASGTELVDLIKSMAVPKAFFSLSGKKSDIFFGYNSAVIIPVYGYTGKRFSVIFLGNKGEIDNEQVIAMTHATAMVFDKYFKLQLTSEHAQTLTKRETEIVTWIASGKTSAEIAVILSVSEHTVNSHTNTILRKLNAVNRTQMVAIALRDRIIK